MTLHTKYLGSMPCGFRQEEFFIKAYVKPVTPEAGPFWPYGYNLIKLRRSLLDDTTPNIKALGLVVSDKKIFSSCSLYKPIRTMILINFGSSTLGDATYLISNL